jgi:superfamily II DNA/RNA helicase
VSARGIDVDNITHIINYDIPTQIEGYLHRAGRTGRMNAVGEVISLVIPTQMQIVKKFTRKLDIEFKEIRVKYGNKEIID